MATTFNVISLGQQADMDTIEGNSSAEGASDLVGLSFGSASDPLCNEVQVFSPGSTGYQGGNRAVYDLDNSPSETFRIDGGAEQTFDGTALFGATITYTDGTTANISAVLFQDTAGNTYLAPEFSANSDQRALEAKPIQSLDLNSVIRDFRLSGMTGDREAGNFMVCFAAGTEIGTPSGPVCVENLAVGDLVSSIDNGPQPIRWIGSREVTATGPMRPVHICPGALGNGLPRQDLWVSQQHRVLTNSRVAQRMFGQRQVLIAAKKLVGLRGITLAAARPRITYWHFLCNRHEVVLANGAPAESLFAGRQASLALGAGAIRNIMITCPDLTFRFEGDVPARFLPTARDQKQFADRLVRNHKPVIEHGLAALSVSRLAAVC